MRKNQLRRENYKIIAESVELNESFFDFYMGMLVAGGGEMTAQQAIGAMLTISSIPIALYGMMGFRHVQRKLNIGGKRLSAARKKLDDIIQDDVRVAVFVDWLQEQPYFDKAIDKLEDANADLKQAYDEKDGAAEEIAQKDIQRILSEFGRALKPDWDKFAAKEGFTKLTDKADIGSGISRNLLNRVNKAGRKYNITNYRVYEDVNEEEKRIPRKPGQPAKSKQHSDLYTDENPEGTIHGLGFKDVKTAKASVQKIKSSDRTHAHKVQAAVAMEQRAREMGKKEEAAVYRSFIDFMKEKTKKMNEEKKFYTKKGKIKQSPEDKESGLPKKYVSGLSDKEAKQKAKEIKKRMSLPKDHPDAYKPVDDVEDPGIIDKKKKEKKSASTTKFQKAFGESFTDFMNESKIKGLQNKADKTGVSYTILKKVYDRGMEAWRSGHRPGIGQHQWAFARVNSFLTGGKTQKTADKDLWAKVPEGKKRGIKAKLKGSKK